MSDDYRTDGLGNRLPSTGAPGLVDPAETWDTTAATPATSSQSTSGDLGGSGKADAAKQEAADLKNTAADQAKDVLGTAKTEVKSVASEAKMQAKDLYAQTQREVADQANTQQQRLAVGLTSFGDELSSLANNAEHRGVATDLLSQVSSRLSGAGTWLSDRDPASVLDEVKQFARRKPATFIIAAALTGIVAGRLTRALASAAKDEKEAEEASTRALTTGQSTDQWAAPAQTGFAAPATGAASFDDSPIYNDSASAYTGATFAEDGNDRSNTV